MRTLRTAHPSLRTLGTGAAAAVLALGLTACGSDDSDDSGSDSPDTSASADPSESSDPSESESAESEDPGDSDDPGSGDVELLDAGSGDMQVLELDLQEGQKETTTITTRIGSGQGGAATPPITVTTESEVTSADDDGYEVTQRFTDVRTQGAGAAGNRAFAALKGLEVELDLTRQGEITDSEVDVPDSAPQQFQQLGDQLAQSVTTAAVPFPSEEVGEGASWRATNELDSGGVTVSQVSTFTLTALDGDDYTVEVEVEQDLGGAGTGTGTGTSEGSLTQLVPTTSQISSKAEVGGQSVTTKTDITSEVS